ncbi:hypothetical protein [Pseudomonas sp.]|uniref:hypothetical protein n=1 Tax=unclassified Pseudomonas TaxID=196821 RepID=UPI0028AF1834|nr:hypothetical protein [Pseudomonas sp.]
MRVSYETKVNESWGLINQGMRHAKMTQGVLSNSEMNVKNSFTAQTLTGPKKPAASTARDAARDSLTTAKIYFHSGATFSTSRHSHPYVLSLSDDGSARQNAADVYATTAVEELRDTVDVPARGGTASTHE